MQNWREERGHFSFLSCPNYVTIFCQVLKTEIIFLDIPGNSSPIADLNTLTNQFSKKNDVSIYFQKRRKKVTSLYRDIHPGNPPPIAIRNSLTNQVFQKNYVSVYFQKRKKVTSLYRDYHPGDSWPYMELDNWFQT